MKYIQLGKSGLTVPSVALGCMRIRDVSAKEAEELVATALELGCNFFEHADIYGQGTCEEAFADAIRRTADISMQFTDRSIRCRKDVPILCWTTLRVPECLPVYVFPPA